LPPQSINGDHRVGEHCPTMPKDAYLRIFSLGMGMNQRARTPEEELGAGTLTRGSTSIN
jgi:hypothetical protein